MTSLGKYELHEQLGRGGFGTVFRATDTSLGREVALKILHPQLTTEPDFLDRFRNEARLVASLRSSNIVTIFELSEQDGRIFIAMDYQAGGSLKELIDSHGPITLEDSIRIIQQVGKGLTKAHARGLIHRDIKPANILFDEDGNAVIGDFGLAHTLVKTSSMPASGTSMVGTPAYMAPELWRGKPASPASDIYSLGCILYEMLTGEVLFAGDTPADVMPKHVLEGPQLTGELPDLVIPVLETSLAKDPQERFNDIQAFVSALEEILLPPPEPEPEFLSSVVEDETEIVEDTTDGDEVEVQEEEIPEPEPSISNVEIEDETRATDPVIASAINEVQKPAWVKWLGLAVLAIGLISLLIWGISNNSRRSTNPTQVQVISPNQTEDVKATQAQPSIGATQTPNIREDEFSELESKSILVHGPESGALLPYAQSENNLDCFENSDTPLNNFITEVDFTNPHSTEFGDWDYGFIFIDNDVNQEYRLTIHSGSYWDLTHRTNDVVTEMISGELVNLNLGDNEENLVKLITANGIGYLFVNNEFVIKLSLAADDISGNFCLASGVFQEGETDTTQTSYRDWRIWQVDESTITQGEGGVYTIGSTMVSPKDGMTMVYVPAGEFLMGPHYDQPQHTVYLDAYWIDQTEVTNAMFEEFVSETNYLTDAEKAKGGYVRFGYNLEFVPGANWLYPDGPKIDTSGIERHPVRNVSWNDAIVYCEWAGRRLPTEAEWEKAARGTDARLYPWGNDFNCSLGNFDDETWFSSTVVAGGPNCDGYKSTAPVGSFPQGASPYGVLDMAGNVSEWVADWYGDYPTGRVVNPQGPENGEYHCYRGDSWYGIHNTGDNSSFRSRTWDDSGYNLIGFRCSLSASQTP